MTQSPGLPDVIKASVADYMLDVHIGMPGVIVDYDKATQRATVQPSLKRMRLTEEGTREAVTMAPLGSVPLVFFGSGASHITVGVKPGDEVYLMFAEGSLDTWIERGGVTDPGDPRRHALSDAIAIVGGPRSQGIANVPDDAMVLTVPDGDKVRIGSRSADSAVVVQSALDTYALALFNTLCDLLALNRAPPHAPTGGIPDAASSVPLAALAAALGVTVPPLPFATTWAAGTQKAKAE